VTRHELVSYEIPAGTHPPLLSPAYRSTITRAPGQPLIAVPQTLTEITGPLFGHQRVRPGDNDLTRQHDGEPQGQRILVRGRVLDSGGRPVPSTLLEIWQANAGGRYRHESDQWPSPLDPCFTGVGRTVTQPDGSYEFTTIKPGAYPWKNHHNAWRPAHVHFSVFGRAFTQRLVTQMYFPDDPLLAYDPIFNATPQLARSRLVSHFDLGSTRPEWALAYTFDIVLRGAAATVFESEQA